jgi:DoxX
MANKSRLDIAWWTLRVGLGVGPFLAGLDKFFNRLTTWDMYLNPAIPGVLHVSPAAFMHLVGVIEMAGGILIFTRFTRYAAYIVMAWLVAISASLVAQGLFLDIAVRDVELALGAFVLAKLTEIRDAAVEGASSVGHVDDPVEGVRHLA